MEVSGTLASSFSLLQPFLAFVSDDPLLRVLQGLLLGSACLLAFLIFYVTRDILHRSTSFAVQFWSIVLVAVLPVGGFFLYLLIRPARTLHERHVEEMLQEIAAAFSLQREERPTPREKMQEAKQTLIATALQNRVAACESSSKEPVVQKSNSPIS